MNMVPKEIKEKVKKVWEDPEKTHRWDYFIRYSDLYSKPHGASGTLDVYIPKKPMEDDEFYGAFSEMVKQGCEIYNIPPDIKNIEILSEAMINSIEDSEILHNFMKSKNGRRLFEQALSYLKSKKRKGDSLEKHEDDFLKMMNEHTAEVRKSLDESKKESFYDWERKNRVMKT